MTEPRVVVQHIWGRAAMTDVTGVRGSGIASVIQNDAALRGLPIGQPAEAASTALLSGVATGGDVPPARYCQMMASDGKRVVMFGGAPTSLVNGTRLDDTWAFDGGVW